MRINFLFIIFITLSLYSKAQISLISNELKQEWSEVFYGVYAPPQGKVCTNIATIFYGEKVSLNGHDYISVMKTISNSESQSLFGYMRQDGEKYYFNPVDCMDEFLLYDFSVKRGNVVEIVDESLWGIDIEELKKMYGDDIFYRYVTNVDVFIDPNGVERKRITVDNDVWIEGIGSINGLLHSCSTIVGSGNSLLSYSEDGALVYDAVCPCNFQTAIEEYFSSFTISPNPVQDFLHLSLSTANNSIQIIDAQGRKVLQTECGETATINVSQLKNGVYTVIVNNKQSQTFVKE